MAHKLKLNLKSNPCLDPNGTVHAMVDIHLNDVVVAEDVQLDGTVQTLTYTASVTEDAVNVVKIQVTNAVAEDLNSDSFFNADDEFTGAELTALDYSLDDGSTWVTLLPQSAESHTVPSGLGAGDTFDIRPAINMLGAADTLLVGFDEGTEKLTNTAHVIAEAVTIDGDGNYFQPDGTPIAN